MAKLAIPPEPFQAILSDVAPSADGLNAFHQAYRAFIAPPVARNTAAAATVDDFVRRQVNLKTMEHVGLRNA